MYKDAVRCHNLWIINCIVIGLHAVEKKKEESLAPLSGQREMSERLRE